MKSTGVTRGDGLSVSVYTRMIPAAEKEPDLTLIPLVRPSPTLRSPLVLSSGIVTSTTGAARVLM